METINNSMHWKLNLLLENYNTAESAHHSYSRTLLIIERLLDRYNVGYGGWHGRDDDKR